jgi:chorismate-pyruvate lyase
MPLRGASAALFADILLAACSCVPPPAAAPGSPAPSDTRLEAALLLETLNAELLSHDSATATLERWCTAYGLASPPRIVAERVAAADQAATEQQRRELQVGAAQAIRYRRVRLMCGPIVLSEADNWYVPGRLTPAMNQQLDTTDSPFGRVVQSLHFQRHTLGVQVLWPVLPQDWATQSEPAPATASPLCLPPQVLRHRALLTLPDGTPFSEVVETYSGNTLAVPALRAIQRC